MRATLRLLIRPAAFGRSMDRAPMRGKWVNIHVPRTALIHFTVALAAAALRNGTALAFDNGYHLDVETGGRWQFTRPQPDIPR